MRLHRLRTLVVFIAICSRCYAQGNEANGPNASTSLRLLIATTTRYITQPENDLNRIEDLFDQGSAAVNQRGVLHVRMDQTQRAVGIAGKRDLFDLIDSVTANGDASTTLVCYLKFHGYTDANGAHQMQLDAANAAVPEIVSNSDIIAYIKKQQQPLRLIVLITESCSIANFEPRELKAAAAQFPTELFEDLFLRAKGITNINSSSFRHANVVVNQAAWMDENGALFTRALARAFSQRGAAQAKMLANMPRTKSGRFGWHSFVSYLSIETNNDYHAFQDIALKGVKSGSFQMLADDFQQLSSQADQFPEVFEIAGDGS